MSADAILEALPQFTGSIEYYQYVSPLGSIILTEGARFIRDKAECFWLVDTIISYQKKLIREAFQVWKIQKATDHSAVVYATDGNDNLLISQQVPYTDFPLEEFTFYLQNEVLHLPSEH